MVNDVNYFLFPNNHGSKDWRTPPYDFNDITNSEYWPNFNSDKKNTVNYRVIANVNKIMQGDVAFFWSIPYFSITTVGIILDSPYSPELLSWIKQNEDLNDFDFEKKFENDFPENYKFEYVVDLGLLQLGENNWITGSDLEKLDEWKNKKPFVRNKDGSLNQQFATPKLLNNLETRSLKERIHKDGLDFISIENISKVIFALNRF